MRLSIVLASEIARSEGDFSIKRVPPEMQPTRETIRRIEREIRARIEANELVAFKSMHQEPRKTGML